MPSRTTPIDLGDGETTTLEQWGESGPALLFVHGIASSRASWARTAAVLAPFYRVFAYDQRGHGDSAAIAGPMTHERSLIDLGIVADAIGDGVYGLIGHSWGGAIALKGGRRLNVERVLAIDPMIHFANAVWATEFVDDLVPILSVAPESREPEIRTMFAGSPPIEIDAKVHAMRHMSIEPVVALGADNDADRGGWDLRDDLRAYPKPLLLMLADPSDSVVPLPDRAFVAEYGGPNVTIDVFAGEGHTLHRSAFERYAAAARAFFATA